MTNKPLTKQQKLEILSQSIDAGASISIDFHTEKAGGTATVEQAKEIISSLTDVQHYPSHISYYGEGKTLFNVNIHLPQKESIPAEWQDVADQEEAK